MHAVDRERRRRHAIVERLRAPDRTPWIDCRPSSSGANTSVSAAATLLHAFFEQEAGGGLDAGDALEVGHPRLELARAVVGGRANLEHRQLSSSSGRIHSTPLCGPYHLYGDVTSASQPSAAMSIRRCGARCDRVDEHVGADGVRGVDDRRQIGGRAEQVRRAGQRDPLRALVDQVDHVARRQRARSPGRTAPARARRPRPRRRAATE